ncbi:MAG: peptide chain release factor-like protein [Verrucomicrobiales bacterium]|jgi:protein subunit release factor B|nr:peptide chain release factor-like protein [Verrucomicrobiales bacterium]|tara:strand:+ start:132 stop:512 length:381 start_codon:yes stop_codon:yes gene_type:complete
MNSLEYRMKQWKIRDEDLQERFVLGSGSGGQKINKTSSRVYLKHLPSGLEVSCQESRSREKNREAARHRLCDLLERRSLETRQESRRQRALRRYNKRRPPKAARAVNRRNKQHRSEKKSLRRRISQ